MVEIIAEFPLLIIIEDGFRVGDKLFSLFFVEGGGAVVDEFLEYFFDFLFDGGDPDVISIVT